MPKLHFFSSSLPQRVRVSEKPAEPSGISQPQEAQKPPAHLVPSTPVPHVVPEISKASPNLIAETPKPAQIHSSSAQVQALQSAPEFQAHQQPLPQSQFTSASSFQTSVPQQHKYSAGPNISQVPHQQPTHCQVTTDTSPEIPISRGTVSMRESVKSFISKMSEPGHITTV